MFANFSLINDCGCCFDRVGYDLSSERVNAGFVLRWAAGRGDGYTLDLSLSTREFPSFSVMPNGNRWYIYSYRDYGYIPIRKADLIALINRLCDPDNEAREHGYACYEDYAKAQRAVIEEEEGRIAAGAVIPD